MDVAAAGWQAMFSVYGEPMTWLFDVGPLCAHASAGTRPWKNCGAPKSVRTILQVLRFLPR